MKLSPAAKYFIQRGGCLLLIAAGAISFPGCTATPGCKGDLDCELRYGTNYFIEYQHVSHFSAGWPTGPSNEEDTLDHLSLCAARRVSLATAEICYGYMLSNGGFYGPRDTAALRVSIPLNVFVKEKFE